MTTITADTSESMLSITEVFEALGSLVEKEKLGDTGKKLKQFFALMGTADKVAKEVTHEEQGICEIIHKALLNAKDSRLLRIAKERAKDVKRANYTKAVIDAFTGLAKKVHEVITTNEFVKGIMAKASAMMAANTVLAKNLAKKVTGLAGISLAEHVESIAKPDTMRAPVTTNSAPKL